MIRGVFTRNKAQDAPTCWICNAPAVTSPFWAAYRQRCAACLDNDPEQAA